MLSAKEVRMTSLTPVAGTMQCTHTVDDFCAKRAPGHALHRIQAHAAAATASKWIDGIVRSTSADGWVSIDPIGSDDTIWTWHHQDLTSLLSAGAPVAVHPIYKVLAAGDIRVSIITL
jgi:hypothetical protein